jgi:ABC-type uncharacterized transport system permease subunit
MDIFLSMLDSTLRLTIPLLLASLAGLLSERSGVVDIGLEGKMLCAAFAAAATAFTLNSAWAGVGVALVVGLVLSLVHGLASITFNGNQMVSGMAINILASGATATLATAWFHEGGQTPHLEGASRFQAIELPFVQEAAQIPLLGTFYAEVVSGHTALLYLSLLSVPLVGWLLMGTRLGLRMRAVGENPHAADTGGVSVAKVRYIALGLNGVLCGIAGAYLSTAHGNLFLSDMTAGKGFLALAALIFGRWKPWPTFYACLLFAFADAVQVRIQGVSLPVIGSLPAQFIQMLPYALTVLVLAGLAGKTVAPKAIGLPYVKSR